MATAIKATARWASIPARLPPRTGRRLAALAAVLGGALALWLIAGVGFVNYDTLYGLVWAQQLTHGQTPQYGLPVAPTPHPLVELLGLPLAPLGASAAVAVTVALGFVALSACAWTLYGLGGEWFGRSAGALAAAIFLTRVPVLSYGVRAYVDIPYVLLVLGALLVETRRRRAGAPVLALLALAGLLRPEAWAFSGLYWLYLAVGARRPQGELARPGLAEARTGRASLQRVAAGFLEVREARASRERAAAGFPGARAAWISRELACLALLAAAAPAIWLASDLLVTGHPLWSLTNTKHTAEQLGRVRGIGNVPEYVPRRIGEVLRVPVLAGAALGGALSLMWLGPRARLGAAAGAIAVAAFATTAAFGLPIDTRYAFLTAAILCAFCGAGAFGWTALPAGDRRRAPWMAAGALVLAALVAYTPAQVRSAHRELSNLARQQSIQDDLVALVNGGAISLRCGPVGVPNHAPIPLLALYLKAAPSNVVNGQVGRVDRGSYLDPASTEVEKAYVLDPHDPHTAVAIPPGFTEAATNRSWLLFKRCG
jgi:hypothetical protein